MCIRDSEYTAENIFFVPENARWSAIAAAAHTPEIGTVIDDAMRSIEKENKRLKDILPKNFARPELDKRRLGEVVDLDVYKRQVFLCHRCNPAIFGTMGFDFLQLCHTLFIHVSCSLR